MVDHVLLPKGTRFGNVVHPPVLGMVAKLGVLTTQPVVIVAVGPIMFAEGGVVMMTRCTRLKVVIRQDVRVKIGVSMTIQSGSGQTRDVVVTTAPVSKCIKPAQLITAVTRRNSVSMIPVLLGLTKPVEGMLVYPLRCTRPETALITAKPNPNVMTAL